MELKIHMEHDPKYPYICPRCGGTGALAPMIPFNLFFEIKCWRCKGTGVLYFSSPNLKIK